MSMSHVTKSLEKKKQYKIAKKELKEELETEIAEFYTVQLLRCLPEVLVAKDAKNTKNKRGITTTPNVRHTKRCVGNNKEKVMGSEMSLAYNKERIMESEMSELKTKKERYGIKTREKLIEEIGKSYDTLLFTDVCELWLYKKYLEKELDRPGHGRVSCLVDGKCPPFDLMFRD